MLIHLFSVLGRGINVAMYISVERCDSRKKRVTKLQARCKWLRDVDNGENVAGGFLPTAGLRPPEQTGARTR